MNAINTISGIFIQNSASIDDEKIDWLLMFFKQKELSIGEYCKLTPTKGHFLNRAKADYC